jgi:hypothetical protein
VDEDDPVAAGRHPDPAEGVVGPEQLGRPAVVGRSQAVVT